MRHHRPRLVNGKRIASPEYRAWQAMRNRCNNPRGQDYAYYGGRGITVCKRWNSFDAFIEDMGPRPSPAHTLERRDTNKPYQPSNCCWATRAEQARNRRFRPVIFGKYACEWAEITGLTIRGFYSRWWLYKQGRMTKTQLLAPRQTGNHRAEK